MGRGVGTQVRLLSGLMLGSALRGWTISSTPSSCQTYFILPYSGSGDLYTCVYAHRIKSLWHFLQHVPLLKLTNPSTFAGVVKSSPSCLLSAFIQIIRNFYHIVRWGALYHWFGTKITW